jgi:hypothetical protein
MPTKFAITTTPTPTPEGVIRSQGGFAAILPLGRMAKRDRNALLREYGRRLAREGRFSVHVSPDGETSLVSDALASEFEAAQVHDRAALLLAARRGGARLNFPADRFLDIVQELNLAAA